VQPSLPLQLGAIDARRRITPQSLQKTPSTASRVGTRKLLARLAPEKISVARLPVTGSDVFGREEDIAFLDRALANQNVNVATIVAWAGVGKSALVSHWLRRMAGKHYRSAELMLPVGRLITLVKRPGITRTPLRRRLRRRPASIRQAKKDASRFSISRSGGLSAGTLSDFGPMGLSRLEALEVRG
jgi:hypothetical protein